MNWSIEQGKLKGRPPTTDQQAFLDAEPAREDWGVQWMVSAYARLSTCRGLGFGYVGPIPIWTIWEYADRKGLSDEAAEHFEDVMLAVDSETLRRQAKPKA